MSSARVADACVIACAEIYRGNGEILANPTVGTIPFIGAKLARATFEPDLILTDGEAMLVTDDHSVGTGNGHPGVVEGWLPYRLTFDVVWAGRRHVVMGASQIGCNGDTNISSIGPYEKPSAQLLGPRGAPGNTVNHLTSYWVPNHSRRVFVEKVDFVSGVGPARAARLGSRAADYNDIRFVISNLAMIDFKGESGCARLIAVHPGVTVDEVREKTGFPLQGGDRVATTRQPTPEEMSIIQRLDPKGLRYQEVST